MLPNSAGSLWNTPNRTSTLLALVKVATNNLSYPEDNHKPAEQSTNKKYSVASSTITTEYLHNRLFLSTKILSSPPIIWRLIVLIYQRASKAIIRNWQGIFPIFLPIKSVFYKHHVLTILLNTNQPSRKFPKLMFLDHTSDLAKNKEIDRSTEVYLTYDMMIHGFNLRWYTEANPP